MTPQSAPTIAGIYRVKSYSSEHDHYWRYMAGPHPWIAMSVLDPTNGELFKWEIAPDSGSAEEFTISPVTDRTVGIVGSPHDPCSSSEYRFPVGEIGSSAKWTIKKQNVLDSFSKIYTSDEKGIYAVDFFGPDENDSKATFLSADQERDTQKWVFELLSPLEPPPGKTFKDMFFNYTASQAAQLEYDIIVVGTGMGGGIVAGDLFDTNSKLGKNAKSVLVIEKGGLTFHSHCLNASRPTGFGEDRAQQNDTFFALFREEYLGTDKTWKGGPMYNLGGRSAAWGLFAPRVHDVTLRDHFAAGSDLKNELLETWYPEAEALMNLSLPATTTTHQNLMERLNMQTKRECQWQWGRITSEFHDDKNFDFAAGAYSTIDKLVEIAMSKDRTKRGISVEHPNFKILLDTNVRSIVWSSDNKTATGVRVKGADGLDYTIKLKARPMNGPLANAPLPAIVLGAGSVGSPAILMRSGLTDFLATNGGLHLTDHDIFSKAYTFRYLNPADRDHVGAVKLQTYLRPRKGSPIALANLAIDASSFLPRGPLGNNRVNQTFPMLTAAFIRPAPLNPDNTITLNQDGEPVVRVTRKVHTADDKADVAQLQDVVCKAKEVIEKALSIEFLDDQDDGDAFFHYLELGGVAHELGTIPMPGAAGSSHCVDEDLKLRHKNGVFVCDLSVFPYSPEVNTSLTLAALALRLSRSVLLPSFTFKANDVDDDKVTVVNHTGDSICVFLSNSAAVDPDVPNERRPLGPGDSASWVRESGTLEAAFVYRLKYNSSTDFVRDPVLFVAKPGSVLKIQ